MGRNRGERFVRSNRPVREIVDSRDGERSPSRPTADQDVLIQEQARAAAPDGCGNRVRGEPSRRDGWTVVQVGDQRDAVAGELRREVGYREGNLRRDEPRVLPAKKRR